MHSPRAGCLGLCPVRLCRSPRMATPQLSRQPVWPLSQKTKRTKSEQKSLFLMRNLLCLNLHPFPLVLFPGTAGEGLVYAALTGCFCSLLWPTPSPDSLWMSSSSSLNFSYGKYSSPSIPSCPPPCPWLSFTGEPTTAQSSPAETEKLWWLHICSLESVLYTFKSATCRF